MSTKYEVDTAVRVYERHVCCSSPIVSQFPQAVLPLTQRFPMQGLLAVLQSTILDA